MTPKACDRCSKIPHASELRLVQMPDSKRPVRWLCLLCWADLAVWLKTPPAPARFGSSTAARLEPEERRATRELNEAVDEIARKRGGPTLH